MGVGAYEPATPLVHQVRIVVVRAPTKTRNSFEAVPCFCVPAANVALRRLWRDALVLFPELREVALELLRRRLRQRLGQVASHDFSCSAFALLCLGVGIQHRAEDRSNHQCTRAA